MCMDMFRKDQERYLYSMRITCAKRAEEKFHSVRKNYKYAAGAKQRFVNSFTSSTNQSHMVHRLTLYQQILESVTYFPLWSSHADGSSDLQTAPGVQDPISTSSHKVMPKSRQRPTQTWYCTKIAP